MYVTDIVYTNVDGEIMHETAYFHLSKREAIRFNWSSSTSFEDRMKAAVESEDYVSLIGAIEDLVRASYGIRVEAKEGARFVRDTEKTSAFMESLACDAFIEKLVTDADFTKEFVNGIFSKTNAAPAPAPN